MAKNTTKQEYMTDKHTKREKKSKLRRKNTFASALSTQ